MNNPWKLATLGIALTAFTALTTGLTTAYVMRPAAPVEADTIAVARPAPAALAYAPGSVPARVAARPAAVITPAVATAAPPRVIRTASTASADCSTGGQRAMRIAKPGLIGALVGAGVGAAGGAIAKGGSGAGKGALIGGLAGTALGAGYGAYKTKQECGTIFGNNSGFAGGGTTQALAPSAGAPAAWNAASTLGDAISVYNAR